MCFFGQFHFLFGNCIVHECHTHVVVPHWNARLWTGSWLRDFKNEPSTCQCVSVCVWFCANSKRLSHVSSWTGSCCSLWAEADAVYGVRGSDSRPSSVSLEEAMDSEGDVGDCSLEDFPSSPAEAEHVVGSQNLLNVTVLQSVKRPETHLMSFQTCKAFFFLWNRYFEGRQSIFNILL